MFTEKDEHDKWSTSSNSIPPVPSDIGSFKQLPPELIADISHFLSVRDKAIFVQTAKPIQVIVDQAMTSYKSADTGKRLTFSELKLEIKERSEMLSSLNWRLKLFEFPDKCEAQFQSFCQNHTTTANIMSLTYKLSPLWVPLCLTG